ncbi:phosphoribosyltransferase [[Eubacterium] cellulosolvens]
MGLILISENITFDPYLRSKTHLFKDRCEAGKMLTKILTKPNNPIIMAIPSGGVPVGYCLSREFRASLDIIVVRKVPIPGNPEAGFGAIAPDGSLILNKPLVKQLGLKQDEIMEIAKLRLKEIRLRIVKFRGDREVEKVSKKDAILVDDGIASGYTILAAIKSLRKLHPKKIIVAVPTGHDQAINLVSKEADEVYCLNIRSGLTFAVADAYKAWYDVDDEEVRDYLKKAWSNPDFNLSSS